ncbi:hypothetical protein Sango_1685000 [Sesamum angolense]|uniref:Uncharacterized protein n=1 Tax=Sesamum angolense TaxID=2727404 RepID=A0AAE1WLA9_9LAMI|nr:hypothetical protein Sango_1685000 [Sesamum angolense]
MIILIAYNFSLLFRFPCRIGVCLTPVEVVACQLIAGKAFPELVMKALLYPGAVKKSFMEGTTIPSPDQLLSPYKSNKRRARFTTDLRHLEVIAGSYLCVAGALLGLVKRGRLSLFGLILILWGISRERDVRKLIKCCRTQFIVKRWKKYSKAKFL